MENLECFASVAHLIRNVGLSWSYSHSMFSLPGDVAEIGGGV
jgi:DNA mismatch repair protein MutH